MRKSLGILAAFILVVGSGVALVSADPAPAPDKPAGMMRHGRMGMGMGMGFPLFLHGVNLTADQKTQVQQIMANHRETFRGVLSQLRSVHSEIESKILSAGNVEEADLTAPIQQLSQLQSQLSDENLKVTLEIRSLLTPDQLAQAAQYRDQMQARREQMREQFRQKRAAEQNK